MQGFYENSLISCVGVQALAKDEKPLEQKFRHKVK
jgi:hypothetical protein